MVLIHSFLAMMALPLVMSVPGRRALSLDVDTPPDTPQPYVIRHYANAKSVAVGSQIYRFPVTGNSSGGAFSLISTAAQASNSLGVLPHIHEKHFENFFNFKGRLQLWGQNGGEQQTRIMTQGDFGAVPPGTNHTFQILDPDTELTGVIAPGGFEALFFALGTPWTSITETPYVPAPDQDSTTTVNASTISALESLDVYASLDFTPRYDTVNDSAPAGTSWHNGINTIATDISQPYFVANGWGSEKYLNNGTNDFQVYQVIQPLVTPAVSANYSFTMSTISIGAARNTSASSAYSTTLVVSSAFEVLEGNIDVQVSGYDTATLGTGDVVFVPANTTFAYSASAHTAFAKVLYVGGGGDATGSLDQQLIKTGSAWDYVVFPVE